MKPAALVIAPDSVDDDLEPTPITAVRGKGSPKTSAAARIVRLRLRAWERRLRRAGLAVIAASFPIAYLLLTHAAAHPMAISCAAKRSGVIAFVSKTGMSTATRTPRVPRPDRG
jgi:hypothetical protein